MYIAALKIGLLVIIFENNNKVLSLEHLKIDLNMSSPISTFISL